MFRERFREKYFYILNSEIFSVARQICFKKTGFYMIIYIKMPHAEKDVITMKSSDAKIFF